MKKEAVEEVKQDKLTNFGFYLLVVLLGISLVAALGYIFYALLF